MKNPDNAIWLCRNHGTIVDNNRGDRFPPELLLSYKQLQEARIAREHQGLYSPIGWLHKATILSSPIFKDNQSVTFAKLNLVMGNNETGKSAICEWTQGLFEIPSLARWRRTAGQNVRATLDYEIILFAPQQIRIGLEIPNSASILYRVDGKHAPVNPYKINLICPRSQFARRPSGEEDRDDLLLMAGILGIDPALVESVVNEIHAFPHANVRKIRFELEHDGRTMRLDLDGTAPGLPFGALSARERETVLIEFATALARFCGRHAPTLLIMDGLGSIFFEGWFDYHSHRLLDPENQFQTILTVPTRDLDLAKVRWNGWQIIRTTGKPPHCKVEQEP